ncbi:imidazole glycerol phosphate synthase subunit HisH [bacterium]|nr:imidazole glycerol phosphate synthase subunit HisH [bacterium]
MIALLHYGAGNIRSVAKALEAVGARVNVTGNRKDIPKADKIVLPGVGAFGKTVEALNAGSLMEPLRDAVLSGKPFLGICLGAQALFDSSEENPGSAGLGILKGRVVRFPGDLKVPHLGWNRVLQTPGLPVWKGIPDGSFFYFAHSYYFVPEDASCAAGRTDYGLDFISAVYTDAVWGLQFHPEKSQKWGLKILENFVRQ